LELIAKAMGTQGNGIEAKLLIQGSGDTKVLAPTIRSDGIDGDAYDLDQQDSLHQVLTATTEFWRTDLAANPPLNRAARDWHASYFVALKSYGIDAVAAFSTELLHADPSSQSGLAQRYSDGSPVVLNTPAIQTNFSPVSAAFWTRVYLTMASLQANAGVVPYLQSGEIQWWYFPKQVWNSGTRTNDNLSMPFYDSYTLSSFQSLYGRPLPIIESNNVDPSRYGVESQFLAGQVGAFTRSLRNSLQQLFPNCRYEVLFPTDTNATSLNQVVNFPADDWSPENLTCLKTESFTYTGNCDLVKATESINTSSRKGFASTSRSHLVGIGNAETPWAKEVSLAQAQGLESVVLFALDQYCLIGYQFPPSSGPGSSSQRKS
jgi:hypothetical protein